MGMGTRTGWGWGVRAGGKHDLANGEADVAVGDDGAIGADFDFCGLLIHIDGDGVALDLGLDGHVREELYGERPGFEDAVLLTENDGALAGNGEGLLSFGVGADTGPDVSKAIAGMDEKTGADSV